MKRGELTMAMLGPLATTTATAAKTSPKDRIRAVSSFIALILNILVCHRLAIFSENSKELYLTLQKKKKILALRSRPP